MFVFRRLVRWICSLVFAFLLSGISTLASAILVAVNDPQTVACERLSIIKDSAKAGNSKAQVEWSKILHNGWCGLLHNDADAAHWATLSAEQNNSDGEAMLALLLNHGWGIARDDAEAISWARKSAEQGFPDGEMYYALMLHHGWGAPKNEDEAISWARKSAKQGDPSAEALLAGLLILEPDSHGDATEALKWAELSAERGHSGGEYMLGRMYTTGTGGLKKDYIEADKWFILSSKTNWAGVTKDQKSVESYMSAADRAEALRRADAWKPKLPTSLQ